MRHRGVALSSSGAGPARNARQALLSSSDLPAPRRLLATPIDDVEPKQLSEKHYKPRAKADEESDAKAASTTTTEMAPSAEKASRSSNVKGEDSDSLSGISSTGSIVMGVGGGRRGGGGGGADSMGSLSSSGAATSDTVRRQDQQRNPSRNMFFSVTCIIPKCPLPSIAWWRQNRTFPQNLCIHIFRKTYLCAI
jgi:hypothetical protein